MKCQRNCPGSIADGYCDTCGLAPLKGSAPADGSAPAHGSAPAPARTSNGGVAVKSATASVRTAPLSTRAGGSGRTGSGRTGSRRRRFGGGLVDVAPITQVDPATAIMTVAEVPEDRRFCATCGQPVGRSRGDRAGRASGFCPSCGEPFNFTPKLAKGDLV